MPLDPRVSGPNETNNTKPNLQHLGEHFAFIFSLQCQPGLIFYSQLVPDDLLHMEKAKFCVEYFFTVASESMDEYFRLGEIFPIFLGEISTTNILIRSHARYWTLKYVLYTDAKVK